MIADNRHYEKVGSEIKDITDDLPFEIPDSWVWCHLGNFVLTAFSGKSPKYSKEPTPHKIVGQQANQWDGLDLRFVKYATEEFAENMPPYYYLQDGDVLLNTLGNGTLGRSSYYRKTNSSEFLLTDGHIFVFRTLDRAMSYYLKIYLENKYDEIVKSANGSTNQTFLSLGKTLQWFIPVPPLAEQARIVAEIEKFEPLIAEYDKLEQQATKLDEEIYDKLKKSILQYAIQGKLAPQDPNDEPASELLERIRAEKRAKLGKKYVDSYIYKGDDNCYYEKVGTIVTNISDEMPFDLPENWAWIRLRYVIDFSKNDTITASQIDTSSWVLDLEDIEKDSGRVLQKKAMRETQSKSDKHSFYKGNVLYSKLRPYLNKVIVADDDGYCTTEILAFDFGQHIVAQYAQIYLMSPYFVDYAMAGAYGVKMPRIGSTRGNSALMPIPPFNEQVRIVERYNVICKKLKDEG